MNSSLYRKLALTNIKNNRKTYIPYVLTAILTVMMFYMMISMTKNNSVGDGSLQVCLVYASWVIAIFAVIFLFYTNSFLIKRRKKELGLYNILGMEKRHVAKMLAIETIIIAAVSISVGLVFGMVFSKLMYLILLKIIRFDINMEFEIPMDAVLLVLILFGAIFFLTLSYNLMQVKLANPIELLRGTSQGEREPKVKWLLTIFGVITLGAGYYIAQTTESPLSALGWFFIAVICVILGTYALFTAGSIALLKMLRSNRKYYYKTKHFTSVSGMIYRMKQNAAGLANICILSTMVLVMVSTTISLYAGMKDILASRFPKEYSVTNYMATEESANAIDRIIEEEMQDNGAKIDSELQYFIGSIAVKLNNGVFETRNEGLTYEKDVQQISFLTEADYNQMEGTKVNLTEDEVLLFDVSGTYGKDSIQINNRSFRVLEELKGMELQKKNNSSIVEEYYLVVKNQDIVQSVLNEAYAGSTMQEDVLARIANRMYIHSFDLKGTKRQQEQAAEVINARMVQEVPAVSCESRTLSEGSFYILYGGLLFIGIYLGTMFLMATVLIIYYKQISEGYEDKERFQIMQKVGMSKREVKQSIRSQILMVFFLPLIMAVLHIVVSFKVVTKLLAVLNLVNIPLFLTCTVITVFVFIIFYTIVFVVTAREYYKIVN